MKDDMLLRADEYIGTHRRKKRWQKVVTALAAVVVFCTTYALILPAITMEKDVFCGKEEHIHTEQCYTQETSVFVSVPVCTRESLNLHTHTADCYDMQGEPVCGYADFVVHRHDASCYSEDGSLWCPLPEIKAHTHSTDCYEAPELHEHTDDCYGVEQGELLCTEEERDGHTHSTEAGCYTETTTQICGQDESSGHQHGDGCYGEEGTLICGIEASEGHTHSESCYSVEQELTCTLEEDPGHHHTEDCYEKLQGELICDISTETEPESEPEPVCEKEEIILHKHDDTCFDENGKLTCGKTEVLEHVHTDTCFEAVEEPADTEALTCTLPEDENHTHTALCCGTWTLTCEAEEHTHTAECYSDLTADVETAEDWEAGLPERLSGEWAADVIAVAESQLDYRESQRNYTVLEDGSIHGYTRYGQWYNDPYGDWCGMFVSFCLHYAKVENMPLDSSCQTWIRTLSDEYYDLYRPAGDHMPQPGDLIFFDWEGDGLSDHVSLVKEILAASGNAPARIKTIAGNTSDSVQYVTYDLDDPAILGYGLLPEQSFYCGSAGHVHSKQCSDACGLEEHIHTENCKEPPVEPEELTFVGADYTVSVQYGPDAALPEGVELVVTEIPQDSEEYQIYYAQAATAMETEETVQTVVFARFFDISFQLDGVKYEPAAPVSVTITYAEAVETGGDADCQAIHFTDAGTEVLDVTARQEEDGSTSFTHTQEGFSVVGNVIVLPASAVNAADNGPVKLPVDYYVCIDGEWVCVGSTKTGWYNNWDGTEGWTDYNQDYITVAQAVSILGSYGFTGNEENSSRVTAYQQKSDNLAVYSDTNTVLVDEQKILPLSRNNDHAGYNLYYLPNNAAQIKGVASPERLDKTANGFYTVKVYNAQGVLLTSGIVKTGGSFTYDATASGITDWLVAYGSGNTETISGSSITINNITSTVTISPKQGDVGSHSVTFKVMIDGQWKTVGSLPYYYSGSVNGSQRAYITSTMAAQMFGDYGYTATKNPEYHFGYSYDDIYTLFYANGSTRTNFCMDISGGTLQEAQAVQLYTSNGSDAQVFRIQDAGNGYSFITPIGNSNYHVNVYGYESGELSSRQLKLSAATNNNFQWKVDTGSDGRTTFWSALAPENYVIDLPGGNITNSNPLHLYQYLGSGGAQYWYMVQQYRIYNNTASEQNADGTWNIGLTTESNGDIVCYYLPAETTNAYSKASESTISTNNSFWSVSVRDDTHSVYSEGELSDMITVAEPGGEASVTVRNTDGILWSCRGVDGQPLEVESSQSEGDTTFVIKNITQPVEVVATKSNPSFTVQYYANIDRYVLGDSGNLEVIDTSGKKLPTNSAQQTLLKLTLEDIGHNTDQNRGNATSLKRVKSEKKLTQMYTDGTYHFEQHPGIAYFDKLWGQSNYVLDAVLVLKGGRSPDSVNDDDWWWYKINRSTWSNITFTNLASEEKAPRQEGVKQGRDGTYCILLEEGTILRLRYETSRQSYTNQANFHDYDITSGQNNDGTWRSGITGINLSSNYVTSGNGQRKFNGTHNTGAAADTFAFGNQNCETGLGLALWSGHRINAYNSNVYKGCTFGLVKGLDENGNLIWDPWITAPHLFNDGPANGKYSYNNGSLQFIQTGDTYTLTTANSSVGSRDNLEYFFNPSPVNGTIYDESYEYGAIYTNNFWPMDSATNKTDPLMGLYSITNAPCCDIQVNGFEDKENTVGGGHNEVNLPSSDDGRAHNWFFGMNFSLSFTLTEDYLGPLEYIFFGDDDMWVFLDRTLICDIGGVHSSVGEYVNLRDYLPNGSSGQHTLSFFYTERGASGSTCWMSFTLPSVTSAATGQNTGSLKIAKSLEGTGDVDFTGEEYRFKVELLTTENGSGLNQTFSFSRSDGTYGTVKNGGTITLHQNETATINGIPAGTFYRVTELTTQGYHTTVNGNEGYIVSGTISNGAVEPASFVNTPYFELPNTGGAGTTLYTIGGLLLMAAAALLLYSHKKRREEGPASH